MKSKLLAIAFLLWSVSAFAQLPAVTPAMVCQANVASGVCTNGQTIALGGGTIYVVNQTSGISASFEYVIAGAPASISVTLSGCSIGGTCETLDTYTTVANSIRAPAAVKVYDYYTITPTGTGGTSPTLTINTTISASQGAIGGGNACLNPAAKLTSVFNGATSGTTATQIIALSGTAKIYVCSLSALATSGTTPTFALLYGTGANCGTGTGNITFPVATSTTTPATFNGPIVGVTPAGNALCFVQTGTTPVNQFVLTYVQQ